MQTASVSEPLELSWSQPSVAVQETSLRNDPFRLAVQNSIGYVRLVFLQIPQHFFKTVLVNLDIGWEHITPITPSALHRDNHTFYFILCFFFYPFSPWTKAGEQVVKLGKYQ